MLGKSVSAQSFVRLLVNNKITLYPTPLLTVKFFVIYILNHLFIKLVVSNMTASKLLRVDVIKINNITAVQLYCLLFPQNQFSLPSQPLRSMHLSKYKISPPYRAAALYLGY